MNHSFAGLMNSGTVQFLVFIVIIILIKESWGSHAASLDVTPGSISKSGDTVTVSWTGVEDPSKFDFLGIYTPPDSDHANFIGWIALASAEGWQSGSGSVDLPLVNMRTPYEFRLFNGKQFNFTKDGESFPSPVGGPIASTVSIQFTNYNEPTQIHLALTSSPKEMRVMFVTRDAIQSFVKYGPESSSLSSISKASAETYTKEDMCDSPANTPQGWRDPGIIHDAVMERLASGKRYFYQVGFGILSCLITSSLPSKRFSTLSMLSEIPIQRKLSSSRTLSPLS
jgi:hypothetical protein